MTTSTLHKSCNKSCPGAYLPHTATSTLSLQACLGNHSY